MIKHAKEYNIVDENKQCFFIQVNLQTCILIRKRNAKIFKHHFLEKNHCDGIFSDITFEYFQ